MSYVRVSVAIYRSSQFKIDVLHAVSIRKADKIMFIAFKKIIIFNFLIICRKLNTILIRTEKCYMRVWYDEVEASIFRREMHGKNTI